MCLLYRIAVKVFNVDNRKMLSVAFVLVFSGSLLIGDWQAIGREDPCLSDYSHPCIINTSSSGLMSDDVNTTSNLSLHQEQVRCCEALSSSGHQCFWNPRSRITGHCCNTCHRICLSKQTTITFYQFTLGIALISFATPLAFVLVSAIASDIAPVTSQVIMLVISCIETIPSHLLVPAGYCYECSSWCSFLVKNNISTLA